MALWLFRRKSRRKRSRSGTFSGDDTPGPPLRSQTVPETGDAVPVRHPSVKKQRFESNKLHRRARTYSFEAGRRDSINIGRKRSKRTRESAPPLPPGAAGIASRYQGDGTDDEKRHGGMFGDQGLEDDSFQRIPTLHASKRDGRHLMPRKSSKRRKNSHDREREAALKAISNSAPYRPATDAWTAGRPMKRDTRRVRTGFGLSLTGGVRDWDKEHPPSDVSLPIPESIHSSMSSDSEQVSYKVSALDALAPKPTLRYTVYPRWGPESGGSLPTRVPSQRRRLSEKEPIPEATLRAHKRIDDLADDLSASDLRELMERDQRRRERKRQRDQDKIERRLARRAEKQKQAMENGSETSPNMERGVLGRENIGLGIDTTSAIVTSSRRRLSDESSKKAEKLPVVDADQAEKGSLPESTKPRPLDAFHRTTSIPLEASEPEPAPEPEQNKKPEQPLQQRGSSPSFKGFLRSKKSRSKSPPLLQQTSEMSEETRKGSGGSSSRGMSWMSIFRWANRNKRGSGPSSFSNTSRDSMATQPQPTAPNVTAPNITFIPPRKIGPGAPKRTLSRFREDLPDFPMSPRDSMQPADADPIPPTIAEQASPPAEAMSDPMDIPSTRQTPTSWVHRDGVEPSPEPQQSMSLASIDSEASWLSGGMGNRRLSSRMLRHRDSASQSYQSQHQHHASGASDGSARSHEGAEDDVADIADDEYLSRYARHSSVGGLANNRKSTGEARPSSDEEDEARWGAVGGRQPIVVPGHTADRVKSREGLLNTFGEEGESEIADLDSPISPTSPTSPTSIDLKEAEAGLQRATSVNLGKGHARHISAGSAKLLELSPRNSVDTKGRGWETRT